MRLISTEEIEKVTPNRYEAVIITSKHARFLNNQRLIKLQQLDPENEMTYDNRKITGIAMKEFVDGKVNFERPDTK